MRVILDILKSNKIARDSRHFEGKSIFTTFLYFSPYVRIQKLGWVIYDIFPCQKFSWEIFDFAQNPPPVGKFSQVIPCD